MTKQSETQRIAAEHNWLRRTIMGARSGLGRIACSNTATHEARALAQEIDGKVQELVRLLEKRTDQL